MEVCLADATLRSQAEVTVDALVFPFRLSSCFTLQMVRIVSIPVWSGTLAVRIRNIIEGGSFEQAQIPQTRSGGYSSLVLGYLACGIAS